MSAPLRVVVDVSAVPRSRAGAGQYTWSLVEALAKRKDVAPTLVARRRDGERWSALGGSVSVLPVAPDETARRVLFGELALGRVIRRVRPEAEVFFGPHYTMPVRSPVPAVVTVHDLTLVENRQWHEPLKGRYFAAAIRRAVKRAAVIVAVSDRTADRLRDRFGDSGRITVVPHGIDHRRFSPEERQAGSDESVLARLGVREPFVLHVGTLEPRKNVPGLISAFDLLASAHGELSLVLAGTPAWGAEAVAVARRRAVARARISDLGYVEGEDVAALLRRAAVVAYPSFEEGFGLPTLEALACGAPLVTSEDTVMSDVAGTAAVLVDPRKATSIAAGLEEALSDGAEGVRRRKEGIEIAAKYTWERSAEGHAAAFVAATK
jgi:glycosyltransferase involved in cell wall biosynthesis